MRRFTAILLLAVLLLSLLPSGAFAAPSGRWELVSIEDHEAAPYYSDPDDTSGQGATYYNYKRGNYSADWSWTWEEKKKTYKSGGEISASFSGMPETIKPGETVNLSLYMTSEARTNYPYKPEDLDLEDNHYFASVDVDINTGGILGQQTVSGALPLGAEYFIPIETYFGDFEDTKTISFKMPVPTYAPADTSYTLLFGQGGKSMWTKYNYHYEAAPQPSPSPSSAPPSSAPKPSPSSTPKPSPSYAPTPSPSLWPPLPAGKTCAARFSSLNGQVDIKYPGGEWMLAQLCNPLYEGVEIRTEYESSAILSFTDMSTYVVKGEDHVGLGPSPEQDSKLKIFAGNVWCNIKKMLKDGTMEVETQSMAATIRGTTFVIECDNGISTLKLLEGSVEVTAKADGAKVLLEAGECVSADADGLSDVTAFDIAEEEENWREFDLPSFAESSFNSADEEDALHSGSADEEYNWQEIDEPASHASPVSPVLIIVLAVAAAVVIVIVVLVLRPRAGKQRQLNQTQIPAPAMYPGNNTQFKAPGAQPVQTNATAFCTKCCAPLGATARFCTKCGHDRAR